MCLLTARAAGWVQLAAHDHWSGSWVPAVPRHLYSDIVHPRDLLAVTGNSDRIDESGAPLQSSAAARGVDAFPGSGRFVVIKNCVVGFQAHHITSKPAPAALNSVAGSLVADCDVETGPELYASFNNAAQAMGVTAAASIFVLTRCMLSSEFSESHCPLSCPTRNATLYRSRGHRRMMQGRRLATQGLAKAAGRGAAAPPVIRLLLRPFDEPNMLGKDYQVWLLIS